jgi:mediator of RNA polymerase II transcription subunit 12
MNVTGIITSALYSAHLLWRTRGVQTRSLLTLLVEMDHCRQLDSTARTQVENDIAAFTHALAPRTDHPEVAPPLMTEILLLVQDSKPDAPSILANSLWYKYRTSPDWAWKVWDNTIAALRQVPVMSEDHERRHTYALRYGQFLLNVDNHIPGGIDNDVLQWFLGTGKSEVLGLTIETWDVLRVVLLFLCVHGVLSTTTLLRGLVYPAWELGVDADAFYQPQTMDTFVQAASNLFDVLVLQEECFISPIIPQELLDAQRIHTRRQDAFREPHFTLLASNIPTLVLLEHNSVVSDDLRAVARDLLLRTCESRDIRQSCYRNLDAVRRGFEHPIQSGMVAETLCEPLVNALKLILSESNEGAWKPTI